MVELIRAVFFAVVHYIVADWWILLVGIIMAVSIQVYADVKAFKTAIERNSRVSIFGSVALGAFTPLCACGTMAVVISMFISAMPWGPVMAFLVSSPLTSPAEYMFQVAFLGTRFAVAVLIASVAMGVFAGYLSYVLEKRTRIFEHQFKVREQVTQTAATCCFEKQTSKTRFEKMKLRGFLRGLIDIGLRKILFYFAIFIALGTLVERLIPQEWILTLFGEDRSYSIPLAATLGLPLHVSGAASLPLLRSIADAGASEGAILAFLIAGKATGIPVIAGLSTFLRARALGFYVIFIYGGAIAFGYLYELIG